MKIESAYLDFKLNHPSISNFSIITETGIELYNGENKKNQNVTVLIAAIASATQSLQENLGHQQIDRFSLSNSSQGYLIEAVKINQQKCLAFLAYKNERNPAKLTWDFRKFLELIKESEISIKEIKSKREKYLFDYISDDEIDRLFFSVEV